jgi:hypothetical protein
MDLQRTNGMKTIGVINIIVGAMFCLIGLLMAIVGGGFMPTSEASAAGTSGVFVMLIGVATLAINVLLLTGGVGLLRMVPWGRTLSLAHAAAGVGIYATWLIGAGFDAFFLAALLYALALIWMFYNTRWTT